MPRAVAFLRAVNVGGRKVPMAALRREFAALGLRDAATFIASGNVVFSCGARSLARLEQRITAHLGQVFGFEIITFLRSEAEVASIAAFEPFSPALARQAGAINIGFLATEPTRTARAALMALQTGNDEFRLEGREAFWLSRTRQSESPFFKVGFEKVLGVRATVRGQNTVRKLVTQFALGGGDACTRTPR